MSGGLHVSQEGRPLAMLGAEERQSPVPVGGLCCGEPNGLLGRYCLKRAR